MYQYRIEALLPARVTEWEDELYEMAKEMYHQTFLVIRHDAANLPEEMLGEMVEVTDMFFPNGEKEPLFEVSGYESAIPMSALTYA